MDAGVGEQLVERLEAGDIADLRDERGARRRTDAGDGLEPARQLTVEQRGDVGVRRLDLPLQEVVAVWVSTKGPDESPRKMQRRPASAEHSVALPG
jgi:hypothetical protein